MTKERFFMSGYAIWDSQNDNRRVSREATCKLLNELYKENQLLKKEILWWKYKSGKDISGDVE